MKGDEYVVWWRSEKELLRRSEIGLIGRVREDLNHYGNVFLSIAIVALVCVPWWFGIVTIWKLLF